MRRPILGLHLPDPKESVVGDIFVNTETGEMFVFDDGAWQPMPQADKEIPTPAIADAGKVLGVDESGDYALIEGGGGGGGLPQLILTITENLDDPSIPVSYDKTVEEVLAAIMTGAKLIVVDREIEGGEPYDSIWDNVIRVGDANIDTNIYVYANAGIQYGGSSAHPTYAELGLRALFGIENFETFINKADLTPMYSISFDAGTPPYTPIT